MKKEVYSWRVSTEVKAQLEREARFRKTTVASLLDAAVHDWLKAGRETEGGDEQRALHAAADQFLGAFAGGNPRRAETARRQIRDRLRKRYGR